jgi:hypothetical protein
MYFFSGFGRLASLAFGENGFHFARRDYSGASLIPFIGVLFAVDELDFCWVSYWHDYSPFL